MANFTGSRNWDLYITLETVTSHLKHQVQERQPECAWLCLSPRTHSALGKWGKQKNQALIFPLAPVENSKRES